jgi:large subunit ribosomal protein L25
MSDETTILKATKRDRVGSRYSKRLRDQGKLPAIVYGHKQDPVPVALDAKEAITVIQRGERVYTLEIEGGETETVLLRDLQYDYLGTNIVHCDLSRVDLDERVEVRVPIHLVGEAKGLKKARTSILTPITEIDLECAVTNLPEFIEVDVSDMDVGDIIKAGEVTLPKPTMVLLTDPVRVIANLIQQSELQEETDESADASAPAAPEVITEKKAESESKEGEG